MATDAVRIGVVGTGVMGRDHIQNLAKRADARVVALCDQDEDLLKRVAEPLGAAAYTDFSKMIADEKLDAVYICVPPHQHGEMEILAARRGLHLYIEKPVGISIEQALRNWDAFRQTGILTQVGYHLRYLPNNRQAKTFFADKEVGTAHAWRWGGIPGRDWSGGAEFVVRNAKVSLRRDGIKVEPEGTYAIPPLPTNVLTADDAFVRAVATGDRSLLLSPYADGIKTTAVTLAAKRSAERGGRAVRIEELLGSFA